MSVSFMPELGSTKPLKQYPWLGTPILPLVFATELTYMEQVAKLTSKVNELIQNDGTMSANFSALMEAFAEWEQYLNDTGIPDGAVTTEKIANGAVTADKLAARAVGFAQLASQSVYGDKIMYGGIQESHIADLAIATRHLMNSAVRANNLANGAVSTDKVEDGAITTEKLAALCVGFAQLASQSVYGDKIKTGGVQGYHIEDGAVASNHLAPSSVRTEKIANRAITGDKIASDIPITVTQCFVRERLDVSPNAEIQMGGNRVKEVAPPTNTEDAATKGYVDEHSEPLVLYASLANDYPQRYLNDSTYGDAALAAIRQGRPILVRVPPAGMLDGNISPAECASWTTALFSPILTYQLPNNANNGYLYLFYLRDEKQSLDLSALGMGIIGVPVYGQLKMKVTVNYTDCPLDDLSGQEYYKILTEDT